MLTSLSRTFTKSVSARAYSSAVRGRVNKAPTRGVDHTTGSGTKAFNEREAALENKAVKEHEAATMKKLREELKKNAETATEAPKKGPRVAGVKGKAAAAVLSSKSEIETLQKQIDKLQAQLNELKK